MSWEAPLTKGVRISESELDDLSKQAQQMAKHREAGGSAPVVNGCPTCFKAYSESCPVSWASDEDGVCHAPSGYAGYCARDLNFGGSSMESKIVAELSCSVCWPCSNGEASDDE